jgi:hypothetical protein
MNNQRGNEQRQDRDRSHDNDQTEGVWVTQQGHFEESAEVIVIDDDGKKHVIRGNPMEFMQQMNSNGDNMSGDMADMIQMFMQFAMNESAADADEPEAHTNRTTKKKRGEKRSGKKDKSTKNE